MSRRGTKAERTGVLLATGAVMLVGGSVAASKVLGGYPLLGGQGLRYTVAAVFLMGWAVIRRQRLTRPAGHEWLWLVGLATVGLAGASVVLIEATQAADPAAVGVVIGAAPLVIAVIFPLANRRAPAKSVIAAAVVVTAGAAIAQAGTGNGQGWSVVGLLLSIGALAGIVGSSLLAAPLVPRLGGLTVTLYACGMAAGQLLIAAALVNMTSGTEVLRTPTRTELAALLYLAVAVTAVVFLAWFAAMDRLGVERLGLFNGLIPIASLIAVAISGTGTVTGVRVLGALAVLAGLVYGLSREPAAPNPGETRTPAVEHA